MNRQGVTLPELESLSLVQRGIISDYLAGTREIHFRELRPIFSALGRDLIQVLSHRPVTAFISWRTSPAQDQPTVVNLSKAFLRMEDLLPKPKLPHLPVKIGDTNGDPGMLLAEIKHAAEAAQKALGSTKVEDAYRQWGIPLIGLHLGDKALDGMCLSASSGKVLVIVNLDQPLTRLRFTLLHELWHALFDQKKNIPPDHLAVDFYKEKIPQEAIPEYRANKWAQLWLIPWADAERAYDRFVSESDMAESGRLLSQSGASIFVLANAIFDIAKFKRYKVTYTAIRDKLQQYESLQENFGLQDARNLVVEATQSIARLIDSHEGEFGESVLNHICGTFQIERSNPRDAV
jgi:Zn-dependent peptidase ImmA (M78 family)